MKILEDDKGREVIRVEMLWLRCGVVDIAEMVWTRNRKR
jgi:hypothetical protein